MNKNILIIGFALSVFLFGCAQHIRPTQHSFIGSEQIFDKNYEIGQKLMAYVGQPIVKVKNYTVKRYKARHMRASDDFVISGGIVTISGDKDIDYPVRGETTLGGITYPVVDIPGGLFDNTLGVLINPDGTVHSKVLSKNIVMIYSFNTSPEGLRFTASKDEKRKVEAGYLNYELIYAGTDGDSITITYREFTNDDLARPAFFQNLVYEAGNRQIRFKGTVIQVNEATSEKIVYTVLADGLE